MSTVVAAIKSWSRFQWVDYRRGKVESLRFSWGEVALSPGFGLGVHAYGDRPCLYIFAVFVKVFVPLRRLNWGDEWLDYGFSFHEDALHLHWGPTEGTRAERRSWVWWYPWNFDWRSTELLDFDRNVVAVERADGERFYRIGEKGSWERHQTRVAAVSKTFPYRYVLRSGEVQERQATVHVERRIWRRKCLPFLRRICTSIEVRFNAEVGEKTGSWKGGCTGCGQDLWPDETPEECLRRMERDQRF